MVGAIGKKIVLIVGAFAGERLEVLEALQEVLRRHHYVPVLLSASADDAPAKPETLEALAQLARFVLVDVTGGGAALTTADYLAHHVAVPIQPLACQPAMAADNALWTPPLQADSVLPIYHYADASAIWAECRAACLLPAEAKAKSMLDLAPAL